MHTVYIGIGSNLGNPKSTVLRTLSFLGGFIKDIELSSYYKTKPYGVSDQPYFLNLVLRGKTILSPEDLLVQLKSLEKLLGRQRRDHWREREIDLDILLYENLVIENSSLSIPHKDMINRDFVLVPLLELEPELKDPRTNVLYSKYLEEISVKTIIEKAPE